MADWGTKGFNYGYLLNSYLPSRLFGLFKRQWNQVI